MSKLYTYSYTVLRYIHDTTTGEFVNVGVVLHAPGAHYANALCRTTYGRLARMFPSLNPEYFKSLMRHIQKRIGAAGEQLRTELPLDEFENALDLARSVLPPDDSSLQWSPLAMGRAQDPSAALRNLFQRMVMQYEDKQQKERRSDEDVWRHFKRDLESQKLLQFFEPKTITVKDDEVEFNHAWKNGVWHCLEPLSFDLSSPDSIRDKAHRWLGQITSVASANAKDPFKLYFLVGRPQDSALNNAFQSALSILQKIPTETEIYLDHQAPDLTERLSLEIQESLVH